MNEIETVFIFADEYPPYSYSSTWYPIWMQSSNLDLPPTFGYGHPNYVPPPIISSYTRYKTYT